MRRAAAALALVLGLAACPGDNGKPKADPTLADCRPKGLISLGESLPDCSFEYFDGSILKLTSLKGTPSVLNFWASWCTFCVKEMPDFDLVADALKGTVRVIGFDLLDVEGETAAVARRYARERQVDYELAFDRKGLLYSHFTIAPRPPTTIFVDAAGKVVHRRFGPLTAKELRDLIRKHLKI